MQFISIVSACSLLLTCYNYSELQSAYCNFTSLVTSCLGLEQKTAYPMCFTRTSNIAGSVFASQQTLLNQLVFSHEGHGTISGITPGHHVYQPLVIFYTIMCCVTLLDAVLGHETQ